MNEKKEAAIFVRLTEREKARICHSARRCGLSLSEYLRKRALGYEPKSLAPDTFYAFLAKLTELYALCSGRITQESEQHLLTVIEEIERQFLLPEKGV